MYSAGVMFGTPETARRDYAILLRLYEAGMVPADTRAARCVQCGACEEKCPQRNPDPPVDAGGALGPRGGKALSRAWAVARLLSGPSRKERPCPGGAFGAGSARQSSAADWPADPASA